MNRYRTYLDDRPKPLPEDPGAKIADRVKELEARGLRKLRHPSRGLKELLKEGI